MPPPDGLVRFGSSATLSRQVTGITGVARFKFYTDVR